MKTKSMKPNTTAAENYLDLCRRRAKKPRKDKQMKDLYIAFLTAMVIIISIILAVVYQAIR